MSLITTGMTYTQFIAAINNSVAGLLTTDDDSAEFKAKFNGYFTPIFNDNGLTDLATVDIGITGTQLLSYVNGNITKEEDAKKILVIGNSLDHHPITAFWWGTYGMAASTRGQDWKHQLTKTLSANNITSIADGYYAATWETQEDAYDFSLMDATLAKSWDLIIIRIGENNSNTATLQASTVNLINYIQSKAVGVPILFGGLIWASPTKQAKLAAAAASEGVTYVDLSGIPERLLTRELGDLVFGDDGEWHEIDSSAVAAHASDAAMIAVAGGMYSSVLSILQ